ncbi:FAD/NAD(P)-binding protein [Georgenia sp. EYE_87]|uniref:FAD/NAD(P)-binding protein n=1 Tax=Georgenia sp. EYE_87 TaxID=2853448 RepID=UPI0020034A59|nr:FAD/NAD(P)-binding protein [Georgenia sp. EYE_87]MCK6209229.1 FAD/NAD(P)-binding protein [Georgenia sp. EYE_87]
MSLSTHLPGTPGAGAVAGDGGVTGAVAGDGGATGAVAGDDGADGGVHDVVVVGGGPRGVALVERLTARHEGPHPLSVALVDAVEVGAGATWRTDQTPHFLNNTYAAHTTVYPDDSTPMDGPVTPGPDLVAWAASREVPPDRPAWVAEELRGLRPWSFPSRRLQGVYFREQLAAVVARGRVELSEVVGTVVDVAADGLVRVVRLADGRTLRARVVVLAQGMVQGRRSGRTRAFVGAAAAHGLVYVEPGMPAERDWSVLPASEDVLVAGLGANFFDVVAQLTAGRGGRFVAGSSPFDLTYLPSGREPHLLVGSRRGLPYRSKSFYGGLPPRYVPRIATPDWFETAARVPEQDFASCIWPQLARELALAHLATLRERRPAAVRATSDGELVARLAGVPLEDLTGVVRELADPEWWIDVSRLDRPDVVRPDGAEWDAWVDGWRAAELDSITRPLLSPRAAVNRAFAALRVQVGRLVSAGAIDAGSVATDIQGWFDALGLALASGPPPERTAQLLALVEAGVVELVGEQMTVTVEDGAFVARSAVRGRVHRARAFAETRMSKGHVDITGDPLLRSLVDSGRARLHSRPTPDGRSVTLRSLDVSADRFLLLDAAGDADERVVVLGIPAGDVQPGSAIGATPGTPSPLLAGADRAAAHALELVRPHVLVG